MAQRYWTQPTKTGQKKVRLGKEIAPGLYTLRYQVRVIEFPYMGEKILYVGPESGAKKEAERIKKATKWPYAYKIKVVYD